MTSLKTHVQMYLSQKYFERFPRDRDLYKEYEYTQHEMIMEYVQRVKFWADFYHKNPIFDDIVDDEIHLIVGRIYMWGLQEYMTPYLMAFGILKY
jgi:hypothetical protein